MIFLIMISINTFHRVRIKFSNATRRVYYNHNKMFSAATLLLFCLILAAKVNSLQKRKDLGKGNPFGIITSYFTVTDIIKKMPDVDGCSPALMWMLARHGSRNPDDDTLTKMTKDLPKLRDELLFAWKEGRGSMLKKDVVMIEKCNFDRLKDEDAKMLTDIGHLEHRLMGDRWRNRLGYLVNDSNKIEVRTAEEQRCIDSAKEFLNGSFNTINNSLLPNITVDNHLINFDKLCSKFIEEVKISNERKLETKQLMRSKAWRKMMDRVVSKTGVNMDVSEAKLLWNMCRFERSKCPWCQYPSWCSVFTNVVWNMIDFIGHFGGTGVSQ